MNGMYLDCGCYIDENGKRHWCPTCIDGNIQPIDIDHDAEIARLRGLLRQAREHAWHTLHCSTIKYVPTTNEDCTCGLYILLAAIDAELKEAKK